MWRTDQVGKGYTVLEREGSWEYKWMAIKRKRSRSEMNRSTETGIREKRSGMEMNRSTQAGIRRKGSKRRSKGREV